MKTIVVASGKGGSTKTTIAALLAVQATKESLRVGMLDLNADQGNLTQWWLSRKQPMNPRLFTELKSIPDEVRFIESRGCEWLIIDTPPLDVDVIEQAVVVSDAVVIPVRPSSLDIGVVDPIVEMCRDHDKPHAFVLSAVDAKMPRLTEQAINALVSIGPVLASRIPYRMAYIQAMTVGKTAPEIDSDLAEQPAALWEEVKRLASGQRRRAAND
jgi:chromosome partitioning protein